MSTGSGFFGDEPGAGRQPPDEGDDTFADVLNGFTLDSGRARRKRRKDQGPDADGATPVPEPVTPPAPPAAERIAPAPPANLFDPTPRHAPPPREVEPVDPAEETAVVRPYALTGGRTRANYALELETLISVPGGVAAQAAPHQFEHRLIMEECRSPRSVAEIASALRVPLGVARVLISDAADAGLVTVHKTVSGSEDAEAHLVLMERVLSGLRRL